MRGQGSSPPVGRWEALIEVSTTAAEILKFSSHRPTLCADVGVKNTAVHTRRCLHLQAGETIRIWLILVGIVHSRTFSGMRCGRPCAPAGPLMNWICPKTIVTWTSTSIHSSRRCSMLRRKVMITTERFSTTLQSEYVLSLVDLKRSPDVLRPPWDCLPRGLFFAQRSRRHGP